MTDRILYKQRDWLDRKYWEDGLTTHEMAEVAGCAQNTIMRWMIRLDVPRSKWKSSAKVVNGTPLYMQEEWLYCMYWDKELTQYEIAKIAKIAGCALITLERWMIELSVPRRTDSEARRLSGAKPEIKAIRSAAVRKQWADPEFRVSRSGANSHWWRGGHSENGKEYSRSFNRTFKEEIRDLDGYCCAICAGGGKLHIHHIDGNKRNTCIDNCVTLCHSCHSKVTASGKKKREHWRKVLERYVEGSG